MNVKATKLPGNKVELRVKLPIGTFAKKMSYSETHVLIRQLENAMRDDEGGGTEDFFGMLNRFGMGVTR